MICGIWSGQSKPILNEFLRPLVGELKILIENGIQIGTHNVSIKIGRILADTPARSLIKGDLNHIKLNTYSKNAVHAFISKTIRFVALFIS